MLSLRNQLSNDYYYFRYFQLEGVNISTQITIAGNFLIQGVLRMMQQTLTVPPQFFNQYFN